MIQCITSGAINRLARLWLWCMAATLMSVVNAHAQTGCPLNCNAKMLISLDEACQRDLTPQDLLQNPGTMCGTYTLSLTYPFGTNKHNTPRVDRSHLGYTFIYKINESVTRNGCWGYITVEDKFPPQPLCKNNVTISCFQLAQFSEIVGEIQDNCAQEGHAVISALSWTEYGCDSAILGRVYRTIRTFDTWGNSTQCSDTLLVRKDSLVDIKCADNISLNCRVWCRKTGATGSLTDKKNYDQIVFNPDPKHNNYPTPELLLKLQARDTFGTDLRGCITRDSLLVPAINDTVVVAVARNTPYPVGSGLTGLAVRDTCVRVDSCVTMWTASGARKGGLCKVSLTYSDQLTAICGNGFKIRREWRLQDWCTGNDTVCVQYIKIQDQEKPVVTDGIKSYDAFVKPHDCIASVNINPLVIDDCDAQVTQEYYVSYEDGHPGKLTVLKGKLPAIVNLPAVNAVYGHRCFELQLTLTDRCFNINYDSITVCVDDVNPPTPLCDERTQAILDPATCWTRIYAAELDNGSRDNCCDVLHFAVARMVDIETAKAAAIAKIEKNCGKKEYWDKKLFYDAYIENHINCYVFNDYIDLGVCGDQLVVLRVYEACGVPLYDPHVFPCSLHDWYCYNTNHLFRAQFNFNWLDKHDVWYKEVAPKNCDWTPRIFCGDSLNNWMTYLNSKNHDSKEAFVGSINLPPFANFNDIFELSKNCFDLSFAANFTQRAANLNAYPPGRTCSKYLYNDCMITVKVVDKTAPSCDRLEDLYIHCDGVIGDNKYGNARFYPCNEGFVDGEWPKEIECRIENDGSLVDAFDTLGKPYGYYGGPILTDNHDEHGKTLADCMEEHNLWRPIYCKAWLCADSTDRGGKVDYRDYFFKPVKAAGGRPATEAGIGKFWVWDNCKLKDTIPYVDDVQLDKCGKGWIKRTWKATDQCGNVTECSQKIIAQSRSDFEVIFPADVTVNCKDISTADALNPGAITGTIMVMDDECELVGVHHEDTRFDVVEEGCYKIIRTWKLTDWCKYDPLQHDRQPDVIVNDSLVADALHRPCVIRHLKDDGDGYVIYTQVIKVIDEIAPVLACVDTTLCTYVDNCVESFNLPFLASDNCTPASQISYRWELDSASNGSVEKRSGPSVKAFTEKLFSGVYSLIVYATDKCGNEDTCTIKLTIKDCKKPTPYCLNGVATVIMPTSGEIVIWAKDLNAGAYDNCTHKDSLTFFFGSDDCSKPGESSKKFDCTALGNQSVCIYVVDQAGNFDKCETYVFIQDNSNPPVCAQPTISSIKGKIETEGLSSVQDVRVRLKTGNIVKAETITGVDGKYAFNQIALNNVYQIEPVREADWMNGVSTVDLMLIQQHVLGIKSLNTSYKMVAADVDATQSIDVVDMLELRKLILGIYTDLPKNKSWKFADKSVTNLSNPYAVSEIISKPGTLLPNTSNDFVAIKIGDVNQTVQAHSFLGTEARASNNELRLLVEESTFTAGKLLEIPIRTQDAATLAGFQFTFGFNASQLDYKGFASGSIKLEDSNFGFQALKQGLLPMAWFDLATKQFKKDDILFKLQFLAKTNGHLSASININSKITKAEAYFNDSDADLMNIRLAFRTAGEAKEALIVYQNNPNPFADYTMIGFELYKDMKAQITVTDVAGKLIKSISGEFVKGYNQVRIQKSDLTNGGVYYYQVMAGNYRSVKKMVLIE